jgi:hypothetical protein
MKYLKTIVHTNCEQVHLHSFSERVYELGIRTHLLLGIDISAALDEVDEDVIEVVVEGDVVKGGLCLLNIPTNERNK